MLDNLINLIRENVGGSVINHTAIPTEKNEQAVQSAGTSIFSTLQNALSAGRINDVLSYFKGGNTETHPIVQEATDTYAKDLQTNVGMNEADARETAAKVVPSSMTKLAAKTADPTDNGFNIQDIFNKLSGGKTGGMNIQGLLDRFGAGKLDKDGDGDVDLQDLKSMFSGGAGELMGKVKGMFS